MATLFLIAATFWHAFAFQVLWGWFIVTRFENAPTLTFWQAYGLILVVGCLKSVSVHPANIDASEKAQKAARIAGYIIVILLPAISLLLGWIVKHWV